KCFQELGLKASVNKERANCADVAARSKFHNYSLVGDAKSLRLSRTAKNAKDFKVTSMSEWKGDSDFAVLVCPYYQYPKSRSQIYGQALNDNVLLFSWEYLSISSE
ncbi:MAG: HindIII family type II restriction endonuclease, partial [Treponema sp.]|nr:HindIII family type II restriction endonuclease [Treponema sp.]